jgi:hypothetical protein
MSKQLGNEKQQSEVLTPEVGKQAIAELRDEGLLEAITGDGSCCGRLSRTRSAPDLTLDLPPAREALVRTPRGGLMRTLSGRLMLAVPRPLSEHSSPAGASPVSEHSWASAMSSLSLD